MTIRAFAVYRSQAGISLVELMIAITLSLILGGALIQILVSSRGAYRTQETMARIQENGRYALETLAYDIRMAGYMGCASIDKIPLTVIASNPPADVGLSASNIINGSDNVAAGNAFNAVVGTDVVTIRRASDTGMRLTGNTDPNNSNVQVINNAAGLTQNDYAFISDCSSADLFRITNVVVGNDTKATMAHAGNNNSPNKLSKIYGPDAEVLAFHSYAYFIRDTGRTTPGGNPINALFVQARTGGADAHSATPISYELAEGVEDLQVQYGLDTDGDGFADGYRTANNITAAEWASVVTTRINLLLHSTEDGLIGTSGDFVQNVNFNGVAAPNDGRLRQIFSSVIAIRNRLP